MNTYLFRSGLAAGILTALLAAGLGSGFALCSQKVEQFEYEEALQALHQAAGNQGLKLV